MRVTTLLKRLLALGRERVLAVDLIDEEGKEVLIVDLAPPARRRRAGGCSARAVAGGCGRHTTGERSVLLVDEVLAVGDAQFQQRCLDRMRAVLAAGTTLIFVSHDLAAREALCAHGIWLKDGVVQSQGPIRDALGDYRDWVERTAGDKGRPRGRGAAGLG